MTDTASKKLGTGLLGAVLCAGIFALDLQLPFGVPGALPYVAVVLLALLSPGRALPLIAAAVTSVLTLLAIPVSSWSGAETWVMLANRGSSLGAIWATAAVGLLFTGERRRRGRAERSLGSSAARARAVLDSAVDGIITIDPKGTIETTNPAAERLFGYARGELTGHNVRELMPTPWRGEHDGYIARYLATGERRIIGIGREVVGRRKDGSEFPLELSVSEVLHGDEHIFIGTVHDITARKQAEELLARERDFAEGLVETAQAIVLVLDPDGRIVRFNPYLERIAGHALEQVRGGDWTEVFLPPEDRLRVRELFAGALAGREVRGYVNPLLTRQGEVRDVEWYVTVLRTGGDTNLLAVGQDITERLRLEERVRQSEKMEAIGRLAGGVAHDFNTLLASVIGYSEMLLDRLEGSPLRRAVEQIHRSAERGAGLTRQLLAFGRRQVLKPELLDLNAVAGEMREMLGRLIGQDIELVEELTPGLGAVRADAGQIQQVVLNLVVNAAEAISGGGRIRLVSREEPGRILLEVVDDGSGMDEATLSRIFEPFFTTKQDRGGTGLGLATVYGIVTQSGGSITVDSQPGRGTTFQVSLPRVEGRPATAKEGRPEAAPARGSETVLVVEDDDMFRELLAEVLRENGYTALTAASPAEALVLAARGERAVDLLVSDMVMPGMSGALLARRLKARLPALRVILMSGYSDEALAERGTPRGGAPLIHKPFSNKDFLRTVRQVLDG